MSDFAKKYPCRSPKAAYRVIDNEAVVVMPQEGTVNIINETGSFIWQLCDGHNSPANIARKISGEFQVAKQAAGADVKEFIRGLSEKGMIIS